MNKEQFIRISANKFKIAQFVFLVHITHEDGDFMINILMISMLTLSTYL